MVNRILHLSPVMIGFLMLGCGPVRMYAGPALPASSVAVLEIENVKLFTLDGAPVDEAASKGLEILPGEHTMRASHNLTGYGDQVVTYSFVAEAGHRYIFGADYEIQRTLSWRPWVKDSATGRTVGSWQ